MRKAASLIDEAMGDTDPNDANDPLLRASQTLWAALNKRRTVLSDYGRFVTKREVGE